MSFLSHCLLILAYSLVTVDSARILAIFPVPSISHQVVFRPLTQELAKRGHEVTIMTTDPAFKKGETPPNITEIDVHDISYDMWTHLVTKTTKGSKDNSLDQVKVLFGVVSEVFYAQLRTKEFRTILEKKQNYYDLLMLEASVTQALVLTHFFKVPVIQVSSFGALPSTYEDYGVPTHPILYPTYLRQKTYNLTLWEKAREFYDHYKIINILNEIIEKEDALAKANFGPDIPSLNELRRNVDLLFVNINPIWEGNVPVPPSVIHMGGLHQKPEKDLPKELRSYLDSSKHGVIYISYGTNVKPSMLPLEKMQIIKNVFAKLPYDILWKWDKDDMPEKSNNIRLSKWLPQSDLLRHPKVKLFITQGGLQSTDEAITAGVPVIGMPMLADQWYNTEKYVHHKVGLRIDMETLTEDTFMNAINTVIEDDSYRRNMIRLGELMRDQPQSPLQRAVWWTEYVLRHGGASHLRAPAANITWAQYLELELVSVLILCVFSVVAIIICTLYFAAQFIRKNTISVKLKQK